MHTSSTKRSSSTPRNGTGKLEMEQRRKERTGERLTWRRKHIKVWLDSSYFMSVFKFNVEFFFANCVKKMRRQNFRMNVSFYQVKKSNFHSFSNYTE